MKLDELQHVLRACAAIAKKNSFVVVGSQAVLLLLEHPPEALLVLREVDLYPALHPELHDLAVSKCVAGREKDADFVRELLRHGLVSAAVLGERIAMLDASKYPMPQLLAWVERRKLESEGAMP